MQKKMKLKGRVLKGADGSLTFSSTMHDGTPFNMPVTEYDIETNDAFEPDRMTVDGWLFVVQEAQQDTRCYLTLPKASLQFGRQVVVQDLQLMPLNASIASFNPKTSKGVVPIEIQAATNPAVSVENVSQE